MRSYNPPNPLPVGNDRTFPTFRAWVESYIDQWFNYLVSWLTDLVTAINSLAVGFASQPIVAAATISPTAAMTEISGAGPISNIAPVQGLVGPIMLYALDGFSVVTGGALPGGITPAQTVPAGHGLLLMYDPISTLWIGITS